MSPSLLDNEDGLRTVSLTACHSPIKNNSHGGWIVQKFGGTSVGKLPFNIAEDIIR